MNTSRHSENFSKTDWNLLSWNVNGLRAVSKAGFLDWLAKTSPDVLALQETKCCPDQLEDAVLAPLGFRSFFHSAQKPGYSGVAVYTKHTPLEVTEGLGIADVDSEGRVITVDFGPFLLINAYFPNSQREKTRLGYKLAFCEAMLQYCEKLRKSGKKFVLCGDYNIAHREIDLANPKTNQDNAGFLPEERAWMTKFLGAGYIDTFRQFHPDTVGRYSWWSYRPGVRDRNIGWRIDYHCVNQEFSNAVVEASIHPEIRGSDHCPVGVKLDLTK